MTIASWAATRPRGRPSPTALLRTYGAGLIAYLPLLVLLLSPTLRSRVTSETAMAISVTVLLVLVVAAVVLAPEVSAFAAPAGERWRLGRARAATSSLLRGARRTHLWLLAEFAVLYGAAQGAGAVIAWMMPHVWANPAHALDPAAPAWEFHYPHYAAQAVTLYLVICFAAAWYACRVRHAVLGERHTP
ncbi:hypothetical protein H7827_03485 [Streptomyces sp. JH002]|uniref:hypothetical protein n=1 Tax=Streptomyces sp. JH002 TaxID=2763259 RepID=UPI003D80160D